MGGSKYGRGAAAQWQELRVLSVRARKRARACSTGGDVVELKVKQLDHNLRIAIARPVLNHRLEEQTVHCFAPPARTTGGGAVSGGTLGEHGV